MNLFYGVLGLSVGFLGPLLVLEKLLTPNAGYKHLLSGYEEALSYALIRQSQPSLMWLYPVLKFPTLIREHHNDSLMLLLLIICIIYISSITNCFYCAYYTKAFLDKKRPQRICGENSNYYRNSQRSFQLLQACPRNLWDMKKFYERFCSSELKLRQAVAVLPWGHTLTLMRKFGDDDNTILYYAQEITLKGWNRELLSSAISLR